MCAGLFEIPHFVRNDRHSDYFIKNLLKKNRRIEINHNLLKYKKKTIELLASKEGAQYYKRRSIEPEPVFGQIKADKNYKRFRHTGIDKVTMDFNIFAIAFNIGKLWSKTNKSNKNTKNGSKKLFIVCIYKYFYKN